MPSETITSTPQDTFSQHAYGLAVDVNPFLNPYHKGGIVLPDSATEKPSRGEVLAVGPGKALDNGDVRAPDVKVGDKVIFGQYGGSTVKVDGEELLILSESEIFGVLKD